MASGFIDINKKNTFSIRWTGFDEIIKVVIKELTELNKEAEKTTELIKILDSYIPPSELEDGLEMGWGFIDERINGTRSRHIELYKLDESLVDLFWKATENGYHKLVKYGIEYSTLYPNLLKELVDLKNTKASNV